MPATSPSVTDWITSVAAVFAALGTVGALWFGFVQLKQQTTRNLKVTCQRSRWEKGPNTFDQLRLRGTNSGPRAIAVSSVFFRAENGETLNVAQHYDAEKPFFVPNKGDKLPKALQEGELVETVWNTGEITSRISTIVACGYTDALGDSYVTKITPISDKDISPEAR
jgi:hypothetical protein